MLCFVLFGGELSLFWKFFFFVLLRFGVDLDESVYLERVLVFLDMDCKNLGLLGICGVVIGMVIEIGCWEKVDL